MANIATDEMRGLAVALIDRSRQGAVAWQEFETADGFFYQGTQSAVVIRSRDGDGRHPFILELFDETSKVVDQLETAWSSPDEEGLQSARPWNSELETLYYVARRQALKLDVLAESLLADIESGRVGAGAPPPPESPEPSNGTELSVDDIPF